MREVALLRSSISIGFQKSGIKNQIRSILWEIGVGGQKKENKITNHTRVQKPNLS